MKRLFFLMVSLVSTTGCEFVVVTEHHADGHSGHEDCYVEPYVFAPEQCWEIIDNHDWYAEGQCCEWDVGGGHFEDWCLWYDQCDWFIDYTGHYIYH